MHARTSALLVASLLITSLAAAPAIADPTVERGRYLVTIMDCTGCHTPGALRGQPDFERYLGGADIGFGLGPIVPGGGPEGGVVYPPNLTADAETGLGRWSEKEILRAITQGVSRDGRALSPVMPWHAYASLTPEDARAMVAYLRTLPAVHNPRVPNADPGQKPAAPFLSVVQ